jgi:hypothetical protein
VGGAAFANLIFARRGARIVGLVSRQNARFCMQANLARFAGAEFSYVTGRSIYGRYYCPNYREYFHAPFGVSPKVLRAELIRAIGAVAT